MHYPLRDILYKIFLRGILMLKKFICLAKSVREGDWCVAGKEVVSGKITDWIRPIGREKEALTIDNFDFGVGSILSCNVDLHSPSNVQKENFIISEKPNWQSWGYFPKRMSGIHLAIPVFSKGYRPKQGKVAP
ncbi:dual OB domain-containing protein [Desulfovibrio sp.]|uniref:dual OB domain-containing protein n=1 Tax=Desulfovibrio sp. TaxID=885 RepID=UPI003AB89DD8